MKLSLSICTPQIEKLTERECSHYVDKRRLAIVKSYYIIRSRNFEDFWFGKKSKTLFKNSLSTYVPVYPVYKLLSFHMYFISYKNLEGRALAGELSCLEHHPHTKTVGSISLSGHIQASTNECMYKWNNKLMFVSL